MASMINISKNKITVDADNLGIHTAVQLMESLVDVCPEAERKVVLDLSKVKYFSRSGLLMIRRVLDEYKVLNLEGVQPSIAEELRNGCH